MGGTSSRPEFGTAWHDSFIGPQDAVADFCEFRDNSGPDGRRGYCDGEPDQTGSGNSFVNSRWYFTINGQVFPRIRVSSRDGEIWRLTNASAQVSYQLQLLDNATNSPMLMQLVAIDGVSISIPPGTPPGTVMAMGGNKFVAVDCPPNSANTPPVCIKSLIMMPASRAEVWVAYRGSDGAVATPPANASATLIQLSSPLGPTSETWPQLKLARVEFAQPKPTRNTLEVLGGKMIAALPMGKGSAASLSASGAAAVAAASLNLPPPPVCRPLPSGHHRRIFFGVVDPTDPHSPFGLGYEEVVDQTGAAVPGTEVPVAAFDPARTLVCLPIGSGGATVHEIWELVNLATETHNFHMHQTRFTVLSVTGMNPVAANAGYWWNRGR